jgi:hypothetical protein
MRTPDRIRPALLPLLVLAAGALLSCGPRVADGPWNVLLVLVDTLRGGGAGSLRVAEGVEKHLRAVGYL